MDFNEYQEKASVTATFTGKQEEHQLMYLALGVCGESGEIAEKIKKIIRNDEGVVSDEKRESIRSEIGDVLWYLSQLSRVLHIPFEDAAQDNIRKIMDRKARGVVKSTGDTR